MPDIILHNYPQSPVAEKVRVAFGIKGVTWHNVEIPRIPPKPMLTKLTGGYRRTPVMQIGADIYCDTHCILNELEQRVPSPSFFPTPDAGLMWSLSRWSDGGLFDLGVKIILGAGGDNLPPDFAQDRGRLYLGADWAAKLKAAQDDLPHLAAQMRVQLKWLNDQLSDGRAYLLGDDVAAIDAQFYYVVWFVRGRWDLGATLLAEFANVERWATAMAAIGHGVMVDMDAQDAHVQAAQHEPRDIDHNDKHDPQGLCVGMDVTVSPDVDGGETPTQGVVVAASAERITIARVDDDLGRIHVHFPRVGYRVVVL